MAMKGYVRPFKDQCKASQGPLKSCMGLYQACVSYVKAVLTHSLFADFRVPGGVRKLREVRRIGFHLSRNLSDFTVPSYGQKTPVFSPPSVWWLQDLPLSLLFPSLPSSPLLLLRLLPSAPSPLLSTNAVQLTVPIGDDGQRCPAVPAASLPYDIVQMQCS